MQRPWVSYDSAAAVHDRLAVPHIFARPARDLAAALEIPVSAKVLDVGAGTGVAGMEAARAGAWVVALDPSVEMLRLARKNGIHRLAAGIVPGLPFRAGAFDRVMASFVLTHVGSYQAALADMLRVLGPGGRLGITAWGPAQDAARQLWQQIAESFIGREALRDAIEQALPWEDHFADAGRLRQALEEAGATGVRIERHEYSGTLPAEDFLAIREESGAGRFLRRALEPERWEQFRMTLARSFAGRVEYARDAYLAVAKPGS